MNISPTILSAVTALSTLINTGVTTNTDTIPSPVEPPEMIRKKFELSPFYQQWIDVEGFPRCCFRKSESTCYTRGSMAYTQHDWTST